MNKNLNEAKKSKNDEFYTQIDDISRELSHYKKHFKGKVIFCNCDDPMSSHFWRYFESNFEFLGLKKLISTHFVDDKPSYKQVMNGAIFDQIKIPLEQNGDFRSAECIELLKEADIVVTNPPFSLFREYVAQLMLYKKKFLIIGNMNAITYKEIFPLLKDNKMWLGINNVKEFVQPGGAIKKFGNINWFTNLDHAVRNSKLDLYKKYTAKEYPTYANYAAINVDKVKEIPEDYLGIMGVPITFLGKHNPKQFKIIGLSRYIKTQGMSKNFVTAYYASGQTGMISVGHPDLCYYDFNNKPVVPYMRVLIKRK